LTLPPPSCRCPAVVRPALQTVEEISAIIAEARKPHGVPMGAMIETDEYIDGAMDEYGGDGEFGDDYQ
jgi:hypothetical protein